MSTYDEGQYPVAYPDHLDLLTMGPRRTSGQAITSLTDMVFVDKIIDENNI
jgi:hypothetical protein